MQAWINPYSSNVILANQDISFGGDVIFGQLFYRSSDSGLTWTNLTFDPGYRTYSVFFLDDNVMADITVKHEI